MGMYFQTTRMYQRLFSSQVCARKHNWTLVELETLLVLQMQLTVKDSHGN